MRKKALRILAILGIVFGTLVPQLTSSSTVKANFEGYKMHCVVDGNSDSKDGSDSADSSGGGATGDWTQKGTEANKVAQQTFDHLTKKEGFSGAGGAGAVAVANRESGFNPKAINSGGGVAGLFQWSGFVNSVNGNRIISEGSIKAGDMSTLTVDNELKLVHYELNHGYSRVKKDVGTASDPAEAALKWSEEYEGVSLSDSQTKPVDIQNDAKAAYVTFGGSKISANSALLGAIDAATSGVENADKQEQENSGCGSSSSSSSGEAGNWAWPFKSIKGKPQISGEQLFGSSASRTGGFHDGIDFGTVPYNNQDILAIHGGTVYKIGHQGYTQNDLGWFVCVKSDDGYYEVYQEFAFADGDRGAISVKEGDKVNTGDKIGTLSDKYANCTHVHIGASKTEIMKAEGHAFSNDGTWVDWTKLVDKK